MANRQAATRKVRATGYWGIAFFCILMVLTEPHQHPRQELKIALLSSTADEDYFGAMELKRRVEDDSDGTLGVKIYPSGQYCASARECIDYMQSGAVDIFMTTFAGLAIIYPAAQVLDLPYLFSSDQQAECVLDGPISESLGAATIEQTGLRLMAIGNTGGWRNFATTNRPVRRADDIAQLKIRTSEAPIQQEIVRRLGGTPTPIAWSELYAALTTGVVQGTKNSIQDIVSMRFNEQIKHVVLDHHSYMGALWWISDEKWLSLTDTQRAAVMSGFEALKELTRRMTKESAESGYTEFELSGGSVHYPSFEERKTFVDATAGMRDWYAERYGREWLLLIDDALNRCPS
ncbi:MAG: C4-dicarboxylate ABC transporter substrate-binding protein [Alphaproteobacteria bacterium]|nr:C4-dicarboxylate ABC transporter substrate-binding protein [Alphaproteobacteria bacterium]